jgi:hypothetical protein
MTHFASAEREVELARRLAENDSPVAGLEARVEPRVFVRDGFKLSMWSGVPQRSAGGSAVAGARFRSLIESSLWAGFRVEVVR